MPGPAAASRSHRDRLADAGWQLRRAVLVRRRLLAVVLGAVAVAAALRATAAPVADMVPVTVMAHDLPAGTTLSAGDLRVVDLPRSAAPDGRVGDPVGRVLAGAMRRGEPMTDARLIGPSLTAGRPGLVVLPVRLPDAGMADLLRVGDRIDLLAADADGVAESVGATDSAGAAGATAGPVAVDCPVLALPAVDAGAGLAANPSTGRLVVLGVAESDVTAVTSAASSEFLTFAFSR